MVMKPGPVEQIVALISKLSEDDLHQLWYRLVLVDENSPFREAVETLMNASAQLIRQEYERITQGLVKRFRADLEKFREYQEALVTNAQQLKATEADLYSMTTKAIEELSRRNKCSRVKRGRVNQRHQAIDAAKAAGIPEKNIHKHMLANHDDLMKTGNRSISEESMWKKYKRQKRAGQLQLSGTNAIIPQKIG